MFYPSRPSQPVKARNAHFPIVDPDDVQEIYDRTGEYAPSPFESGGFESSGFVSGRSENSGCESDGDLAPISGVFLGDQDYPDPFEEEDNTLDVDAETQDVSFVRAFIVDCAGYVEQLEAAVGARCDEFWEAREHAYRIITAMLIDVYESRFEGE